MNRYLINSSFFTSLFAFLLFGCSTNLAVQKWDASKVFKKPESVAYDSIQDYLYITNINGRTTKKDGNGFITKMKTNGKIDSIYWLQGFNAPKGIIYKNNHLYLTDINTVYIINIDSKKIVSEIIISDAIFLNDIVVADDETIYVSDTKKNCIFKIKDRTEIFILEGTYKGANGLFLIKNNLYVGTKSSIYKYNLTTNERTIVCDKICNVDGLYVFSDTHFLISNFINKLIEIKVGKKTVLHKGIPMIDNYADFYYLENNQSVVVPMFSKNEVRCLTLP